MSRATHAKLSPGFTFALPPLSKGDVIFIESGASYCGMQNSYVSPGRRPVSFCLDCGHFDSRELLVNGVALFRGGLRFLEKVFEARGIGAFNHTEARLVAHVVGNLRLGRAVVEMERRLALRRSGVDQSGRAARRPIRRPASVAPPLAMS